MNSTEAPISCSARGYTTYLGDGVCWPDLGLWRDDDPDHLRALDSRIPDEQQAIREFATAHEMTYEQAGTILREQVCVGNV